MPQPYTYNATVVRVVDGDTVIMDVDLGFSCWVRDLSFRLLGCNAREHSQIGGKEARANLEKLLPAGMKVKLTSVQTDKFGGRYDALIMLPDGNDLATLLVESGWAAAWTGNGAKPVPPWPRKA